MISDARPVRWIASLIVLLAIVRLSFVISGPTQAMSLTGPTVFGTAVSITRQRFDPDALILLAPGDDGLPGQAGMDDDFNGVNDNAGEMGAVGSDDVCLAPWNDGYDAALADLQNPSGHVVAISRGGFLSEGQLPASTAMDLVPGTVSNVRYLITGRNQPQGDSTKGNPEQENPGAWSRLIMDRQGTTTR